MSVRTVVDCIEVATLGHLAGTRKSVLALFDEGVPIHEFSF